MYRDKKVGVIIAAAGSGTRMGGGISKQFRMLRHLPVLTRAVRVFDRHPYIDEILVVTKEDSLDFCRQEMIAPYGLAKVSGIIAGGDTRQDSVYRGLLALEQRVDLVLVHDGARPFLSPSVLSAAVETASEKGAAVVAVPVKDTIKITNGSAGEHGAYFEQTPDRSALFAVQTPQAFDCQTLLRAMKNAFAENFYGTDDSVLVERTGQKVYLVKGNYENIKITTAEDLYIGEAIAQQMDAEEDTEEREMDHKSCQPAMVRMGTGFDVHRLVPDRKLILGGVEIPYEKGLLGHSDADVLIHAIMDALLGAAALGDIGQHFPDKDEAYRGISSVELLKRVSGLLGERGYSVGNVDAVVIAQQPKIAPYIPRMKAIIVGALSIDEDRISIKGTTTEGLGYCGRGEGIASQAAAVIYTLVQELEEK